MSGFSQTSTYNMVFSADVKQARADIQSLISTLDNLALAQIKTSGTSNNELISSKQFQQANAAAKELSKHLTKAFNSDTGKIDLSKFNTSLRQSNQSLTQLMGKLGQAGQIGQNAFSSISAQLAQAEQPLKKTNKLMDNLAQSLKNQVQWQVSSSIVNSFVGNVQRAVSYAKDLNSSLNDIRIVTGSSSEQMAKFAVEANKSAKALSTSTTRYTDASLIFYQQGLDDAAVKERTDAVIKMANVTGESSSQVASYMTAIWNNFAKGGQDLEHYADVITALGAATAASSAEIAGGLEKFASIGEMIGLSYDYATAALATIVDKTRQSEDVVGTALKTIFARIQGLNLGETLDDGTSLNKYSNALMKVGINIKDSQGELKDMDSILDEMGAKWNQISKDQQVALAQTVAGTRQYNQLVSLMENWDAVKQNVEIARTADGTLQSQADIYAESWEAASMRVKAATEGLFDTIIEDDVFITALDGIAGLIGGIDSLVGAMGGLKTIIPIIGALFLNHFSSAVPGALKNIGTSLMDIKTGGQYSRDKIAGQNAGLNAQRQAMIDDPTVSEEVRYGLRFDKELSSQRDALEANRGNMTPQEYQEERNRLDVLGMRREDVVKNAAKIDNARKLKMDYESEAQSAREEAADNRARLYQREENQAYNNFKGAYIKDGNVNVKEAIDDYRLIEAEGKQKLGSNKSAKKLASALGVSTDDFYGKTQEDLVNMIKSSPGKKNEGQLEGYAKEIAEGILNDYREMEEDLRKGFEAAFDEGIEEFASGNKDIKNLNFKTDEQLKEAVQNAVGREEEALRNVAKAEEQEKGATNYVEDMMNKIIGEERSSDSDDNQPSSDNEQNRDNPPPQGQNQDQEDSTPAKKSFSQNAAEGRQNLMQNFDMAAEGMAKTAAGATEVVGAVAMGIGAIKTLGDESASTGEKMSALFTSAAAGVPMAINGVSTLQEGFKSIAKAAGGSQAAIAGMASVIGPLVLVIGGLVAAFVIWDNLVETNAEKIAKLKKAQQDLASESQKATEQAEGLKAALEGYEAAESKIRKCTRGTQEWADALGEVQDAIDKIGQLMPDADISSMISRQNGELVLDTAAVESAIKEAENRASQTAVAADFAGTQVRQAQIEGNKANLLNDISNTIFQNSGVEIGDTKAYSQKLQDALTDSVSFEDFAAKAKDAFGEIEGAQASTFNEIKGSLRQLYEENQKLQQNDNNQYQKLRIKTEQELGDFYGEDGIANDYAAAQANEKRDEYFKNYMTEFTKGVSAISGTGSDSYQKALEIMQAAGYNYSESKGNAVIGSDTKRKFTFTDNATGTTTEGISAEFIADLGAAQQIMKEVHGDASKLSKFMLDNKDNGLGNIAASIAQSYDGTDFNTKNILSNVKIGQLGDLSGLDGDQAVQIAAHFKTDKDEIAEFAKEIQAELSEAEKQATNQKNILTSYLGDDANIEDISVATMTKLNSAIVAAASGGMGADGSAFMSNFINQLLKGAKPEDASKILDIFSNVDWTQWDAMYQFQSQLEGFGITLSGIDWSSAANGMRQIGLASPVSEFTSMASALETIIGLLDKLKVGAKLSGEEMEAIKAKLPNWEDYFIQTGLNEWTQIGEIVQGIDAFDFDTSKIATYSEAYNTLKDKATANGVEDMTSWGDTTLANLSSEDSGVQLNATRQAQEMAKAVLIDSNGQLDQNVLDSLGYTEEAAQALMSGATSVESMTKFIQAVQQFAQDGAQSQGFSEEFINQMKFQTASSVVDMQSMDGFYKENGDISDGGVAALQERASKLGDEGADALKAYRAEIDNINATITDTAKKEELAAEAANKFKSQLQDIEADKVAKDLKKLTKEYGKLTDEAEKTESLKKQKELLDEVFGGKGVDTDWIKDNQKTIDKWLNGTQEEMEEAGREIMKQAGVYQEAAEAQRDAMVTAIGDGANSLASFAQNTLGMQADAAESFANRFISACGGADKAAKALDGVEIDVNGQADLSQIISACEAAGMSAAETASFIAGLSQSGVDFSVDGEKLPAPPGEGATPEQFIQWYNDLKAKSAFSVVKAQFPADAPTPRMTGGGSSGGGGGGGGGKKKTVEKTKLTDEKERYHVIKNQLEDISDYYDGVAAARDRAFGKANLNLLNEEIGLQADLIAGQEEYIRQIQDYLQQDQNVMSKYGAQFDANGTITNYDQLMAEQVGMLNRAEDAFNNDNGDQETAQENLDKAKEKYEQFLEDLQQYEETQDLLKEANNELFDMQAELQDKLLEATEIKVDMRLDLSEDELKRVEFLLGQLEDDAFAAAEKIALIGDKAYESMFKAATYRNGLNEIFSRHGISGALEMSTEELIAAAGDMLATQEKVEGFSADEIDTMREYVTSLIDEAETLTDARKEVFDALGEQFEAGLEDMDLMLEKQEHLQTMAEAYSNIIDIVGKRQLGISTNMLAAMRQAQVEVANNRTAAAREREDAIRAELLAAQEARDAAAANGWDDEVKFYDEQIKEIQEAMREAEEETMSALEDSLSAIQDLFDSTFENIVDDFKTAMGGMAGHMDVLQDQFDRSSELDEKYVAPYERVYELTKLIRDAGKSIDETDNVKAQKELLALQQEFMDLRNSDKELSEYDLNYLRLRYEAKVAEMALDEAKDVKSQVRMTRDNNGNFSYVYTASEDDVAAAEQAYEDKLYQMQVANGEYMQQLQEDALNLENTYLDSLQNIKDTLTIGSEEYYNALDELNTWYTEMVEVNNSQMGEVIANNNILYEFDVANYNRAMQAKALEDANYIAKFSEMPLAILAGYETIEEMTASHNEAHKAALDDLSNAEAQYVENNKSAMNQLGLTYENFSSRATTALQQVENESNELDQDMKELAKTIQEDFANKGLAAVQTFCDKYSDYINIMCDKTTELVSKFNELVKVWGDINKEAEINNNWQEEQARQKAEYEAAQRAQAQAQTQTQSYTPSNNYSSASTTGKTTTTTKYVDDVWEKKNAIYLVHTGVNSTTTKPGKITQSTYDTGGYTGEWGPEGKEAILHEKELVLNKTDTENILSAVDIVRHISKLIDMSAAGMMSSSLLSGSAQGSFAQTPLEQQVHITAEFPNATDRNEILAAFDNIVNLASQYAGR